MFVSECVSIRVKFRKLITFEINRANARKTGTVHGHRGQTQRGVGILGIISKMANNLEKAQIKGKTVWIV